MDYDMDRLPAALDLLAPRFERCTVWLPELARAERRRPGADGIVRGRTFEGCVIEGPAVLLAIAAVHFDRCAMGDPMGNIGNLLLRPLGERASGVVPMLECVFRECRFEGIGFTGAEGFLDSFLKGVPLNPGQGA